MSLDSCMWAVVFLCYKVFQECVWQKKIKINGRQWPLNSVLLHWCHKELCLKFMDNAQQGFQYHNDTISINVIKDI